MHSNSSLEQLESALKDAMLRLKALAEENSRLRAELVDKSERMRTAGNKLRVVAERLPKPAEETAQSTPQVQQPPQIKVA
ncbi:MAG TPA: hypothetical protein PLJ16_09125 [Casimicrobium huifangae]|jgi:chromosome segregation ATPase|uniref:hypothetical protein n=1 Tax=Casimicrobium huifangae TaxID=2591109 RepID=UPI0012EBFA0D|nr:hypothetical protein [Casimicrobium huifangae]HQD65374.1 hypothetical protein [Casimicrobium huifangae]